MRRKTSQTGPKKEKTVRARKAKTNSPGPRQGHGLPAQWKELGLEEILGAVKKRDLEELYAFWCGREGTPRPESEEDVRRQILSWMSEPARVEERVSGLGRRLGAVLEHVMSAPRYARSWSDLSHARSLATMSDYDLEACVAALGRRGFVAESKDRRFEAYGDRVVAVPAELGDGLMQWRRERLRGIFGVLTLRGHLDQVYSDPERAKRITPQRLRELYKMYSQETASVARIERLPEGVRGLVEKAILEFGGVLPRQLFERMDTELPHWNGRRWRMILEQSLVGTVQELDLSRYGIQHQDETLVVFNEVALAWLRRVAVPGDPDRPHEELTFGIDLASNISRFLNYIEEHDVRFTVQGEIFKTTEKKILQHLIPNPGRELERSEVLSFIFRFARSQGLIDRTGERTFSVTTAGREWGGEELAVKQDALLQFALGDRRLTGEHFHQQRMREIFVRLVKRIEPGVWYDLMYLPFLARNTYLSTLDDLRVEEHFSERSQTGRIPAMEDPQRLAWNLVKWVRKRLYPLGAIDLGYDGSERPVALRLTAAGARMLGMEDAQDKGSSSVGSLVVTPDFEVVLFPTGDDAQLVHDLDRFSVREKLGSVVHFRIGEDAVRRALKNGMTLASILGTLESHSRTPVPQNVSFSIRDWALRAGLMSLGQDLVLRCHDGETLRRFQSDPGARKYVRKVLGDQALQLASKATPRRMQALLRELGYLIELGDAI